MTQLCLKLGAVEQGLSRTQTFALDVSALISKLKGLGVINPHWHQTVVAVVLLLSVQNARVMFTIEERNIDLVYFS